MSSKSPLVSGFACSAHDPWPPCLYVARSSAADSTLTLKSRSAPARQYAPKHHLNLTLKCATTTRKETTIKVAVALSNGRILVFTEQSIEPLILVKKGSEIPIHLSFMPAAADGDDDLLVTYENGKVSLLSGKTLVSGAADSTNDPVTSAAFCSSTNVGLCGFQSGRLVHMFDRSKRLAGHTSPIVCIKIDKDVAITLAIDDFFVGVWCLKTFDFNGIGSIPFVSFPRAVDCLQTDPATTLVLVMDETSFLLHSIQPNGSVTQRHYHELSNQAIDALILNEQTVGVVVGGKDYKFEKVDLVVVVKAQKNANKTGERTRQHPPLKRSHDQMNNDGDRSSAKNLESLTFLDLMQTAAATSSHPSVTSQNENLLCQAIRSGDKSLLKTALSEPPTKQLLTSLTNAQVAFVVDRICSSLVEQGIPGMSILHALEWLNVIVESIGNIPKNALARIKRICDNRAIPLARAIRLGTNINDLIDHRSDGLTRINLKAEEPNCRFVDCD